MMIVAFIAFALLAVLLGFGRGLIGDILHFVSVVISAVIALSMAPALSAKIYELAQPFLLSQLKINDYLNVIIQTTVNPLSFVLVFIATFVVIGLLTHIIAGFIKPAEKKNHIVKTVINAICGLVIAYVVTSPLGFYPAAAEKTSMLLRNLGEDINIPTHVIKKFAFSESVYKPLISRLTKIRFGEASFSVDESIDSINSIIEKLPSLSDEGKRNQLIEELKADGQKDIINGYIIQAVADYINDTQIRKVMNKEGKLSSKLTCLSMFNEVTSLFTASGEKQVVRNLTLLMKNADPEIFEVLAQCCDFDALKIIHLYDGYNAPFVGEIVREIGRLQDKSEENITKEAEAIAYLLAWPEGSKHSFDYNKLDPDKVAASIENSTILKNALINVTDNATNFNPCDLKNRYYDSSSARIISRLEMTYGYTEDSQLIQCIMYYFGITKA
ncbi:MAG: CvpA family protein [Erysipelotrichaceae bacterium]|nr:CvpA family protein [Erysipelotrichaceae bacterium]